MKDAAIIDRCLIGDVAAWNDLTHRYSRAIFSLCLQFTGNRQDAEDLTQEVFLRVYLNLHRYEPRRSFLSWAMKIARNLCIDRYRRSRKEKSFALDPEEILREIDSGEDLHRDAETRERTARALAHLHELPEESVALILMRDVMGFSYEELSDLFDVPVGTIKSRLNRTRFAIAASLHAEASLAAAQGGGA